MKGQLVALGVAILMTACTASPGQPEERQDSVEIPTATVTKGPITSVLVVGGSVTASPHFVVEAPNAGQVIWESEAVPDASVEQGQVLGTVGGQPVVASAPGRLVEVLVPSDATVVARIPIATVAYQGFGVQAVVPVAEQYRLYERTLSGEANIDGGPAGLSCQPVPIPDAVTEGGVATTCLLPLDAPVVAGLNVKVGLTTASKDSALLLPVEAVSGRVGSGEVTRVSPEGAQERVPVTLGITDGARIEILEGLAEGDVVLGIAPTLG